MQRYLIVLFLGILFLNQSCLSRKKLVYLQDIKHNRKHQKQTDTLPSTQPAYLIRPGDVLYVNVTSYKGELSQFFNQKSEAELNTTNEYLAGYVVSQQGKIKLPVLDSFTVAGKSLLQIQIQLADSIHQYIEDADVIVKLASFHFTVLGEVRSPGIMVVKSDHLT